MKIPQIPLDVWHTDAASVNPVDPSQLIASTETPSFQQRLEKALNSQSTLQGQSNAPASSDEELRKAFQDFVGQTLFSQMIASMRKTQEGAAYFNGGQAEKIFQSQLDQILSQELSDASASQISDPMFRLFQLRRS